jgi:hypothetical protein
MPIIKPLKNILDFYVDGFRRMTVGRSLWKLIIIKIFIIFGIIKLFFFPNFLQTRFNNDNERAAYVMESLSRPNMTNSNFGGQKK